MAIRLFTTPRTSSTADCTLLQQDISFLIHTNLLNDFMALVEGYSQLESANFPLSIERVTHTSKSRVLPTSPSARKKENGNELCDRSPLVQRLLNSKKNHGTYRIVHDKSTPPGSPSLFALTRQFFTRNPTKLIDIDEQETISNVPNRTSLVTWRSLADTQTVSSLPAPVLYRTVIHVQPRGKCWFSADRISRSIEIQHWFISIGLFSSSVSFSP